MALVLTKTVSRSVPLIKCMKGRSFATLAKKSPAIAVNAVVKNCSLVSQRVQTLTCWTYNLVKQMPVPVAKKRTCCRCSAMPRSSSCSALLTKRPNVHANHLQRSRSCVRFNNTSSAFIVTPANHGPSPVNTKNSNCRPGHVTQQNVACSSGPGKKEKDLTSPGDFCAMGPCNCPWPGGCPPPGFCGQQSVCNPCAIGCGCCPCPPCPQMPQMPQCNQMPGQCPCCGGCPQMAGPCGAFVPCGACGAACGPCPCPPPPCGPPQGGMCGTWGPCCGGGPQWGAQGVPCPFPCPCSPCGQCGQTGVDKKKK